MTTNTAITTRTSGTSDATGATRTTIEVEFTSYSSPVWPRNDQHGDLAIDVLLVSSTDAPGVPRWSLLAFDNRQATGPVEFDEFDEIDDLPADTPPEVRAAAAHFLTGATTAPDGMHRLNTTHDVALPDRPTLRVLGVAVDVDRVRYDQGYEDDQPVFLPKLTLIGQAHPQFPRVRTRTDLGLEIRSHDHPWAYTPGQAYRDEIGCATTTITLSREATIEPPSWVTAVIDSITE